MASPRTIDGMILTKFDTIDDKVGACLSMTFVTGKPILFVGTGQTYTDLRQLNVNRVVQQLLSWSNLSPILGMQYACLNHINQILFAYLNLLEMQNTFRFVERLTVL